MSQKGERSRGAMRRFGFLAPGQEKGGQGFAHASELVTDVSGALANTFVRLDVVAVIGGA